MVKIRYLKRSSFLVLLTIVLFAIPVTSQVQQPIKPTQKRSVSQREFKKAVQSFYLGSIESAIAIHEKNIAKDPLFFNSYFELIALYKEVSRNQDALRISRSLHALHPKSDAVNELYFITSVQANQLALAQEIEKFLLSPPKHIDTLFYQGFLAYRKNNYRQAIEIWEDLLKQDPTYAAAAFFTGLAHQQLGNHQSATEAFNKTLKIEPNFTSAYYPLALSQLELGQKQSALTSLRRVRNLIPHSQRVTQKIVEIEASLPPASPPPPSSTISQNRQTTINIPIIKTFAPEKRDPIPIRIGLIEDIRELQIKTGGSYQLKDIHGKLLHQGHASEVLIIKATEDQVVIFNIDNILISQSRDPIRLSYPEDHLATAVFDIINGAGYYFASVVTRYYRGELEFMPKANQRLTLINQLNLEEYLYSVVPSEMPASWPEDALRAQAVAARTYALATMGGYKERGFDLLSSVASQAYTGIAGEHPRTTAAVNATSGMVLYSKVTKKLLVTYYSANHGGYSEDGEMVWTYAIKKEHLAVADLMEDQKRKESLPLYQLHHWIKSRPQTHSNIPKHHSSFAFRSAVWIDNEDLQARLMRTKDIGAIQSITTRSRGISGRSAIVEAQGSSGTVTIKGDVIRSHFGGLRSNLFTLESITNDDNTPEYFVFTTAGWGHGVGLDQSGAAGMASDGYTWKEILKHYYPNGDLKAYQQ